MKSKVLSSILLLLVMLLVLLGLNRMLFELDSIYFWSYEIIILLVLYTFVLKHKSNNTIIASLFFIMCLLLNVLERFFIITLYLFFLHMIFVFIGLFFLIKENRRVKSNLSELNNKLKELAFYNAITKLPNRNYLFNMIPSEALFNGTFIKDNSPVYCFYIDIDDFKMINNYFGDRNGDEVLKIFANRIKSKVSKDDHIIHMSADKFFIVAYEVQNYELFANELLNLIKEPFIINHKEIRITCTIGITIYPDHMNGLPNLLKRAELTVNKAKELGKNQYVIFNEALETEFDNRYRRIHDLKYAIDNKDFLIYFQPKAQTISNKITSLEALVRWNHPKHGIIFPNDFIPLAEDIGVIDQIDLIVLELTCKQIKDWTDKGKIPYTISVNISPQLLSSPNFILYVDEIISTYNINSNYLNFEITETVALTDFNKIKKIIKQLKLRNIKISIDDFGKGYSSINYLKQFNFDYLKIDKTFIDGIPEDHFDAEIIKMIINMSQLFGFKIICEGVEHTKQLEFLKKYGCQEYQGYLLSKPKPLKQLDLDFNH